MKKIANIGKFEELQNQANHSFGFASVFVFNGDFTSDIVKAVSKRVNKYSPDPNSLAKAAGIELGLAISRKFNSHNVPIHSEMPSNYSHPNFYECSPKEQRTYLMKECRDLALSLSNEYNIRLDVFDIYSFVLFAVSDLSVDTDEFRSNAPNEHNDISKEYGL